DRFDFDEVVASCNGFSEAMNSGGHGCEEKLFLLEGVGRILRCCYPRSSEATDESTRTMRCDANSERDRRKKNCVVDPSTGNARTVHRISTSRQATCGVDVA